MIFAKQLLNTVVWSVFMSSPFPFHGIFSSLGDDQLSMRRKDKKQAGPFSGGDTPLPGFFDSHDAAEHTDVHTPSVAGEGQVAVDVFEQDGYYIIRAPIAGVKLSDLDIEINDSVVTIRGNRQPGDSIPENQYYVQECYWGEFQRSITLPCQVDARKVKATFNKESILKILIPKEERVKIVRINEG